MIVGKDIDKAGQEEGNKELGRGIGRHDTACTRCGKNAQRKENESNQNE